MPVSCYKGVIGKICQQLTFMNSWIAEELLGVDGQIFKVTEFVRPSHTICFYMVQTPKHSQRRCSFLCLYCDLSTSTTGILVTLHIFYIFMEHMYIYFLI